MKRSFEEFTTGCIDKYSFKFSLQVVAKLQNTGPLNKNSIYCIMPRSTKNSDTLNKLDRSGPVFCYRSQVVFFL